MVTWQQLVPLYLAYRGARDHSDAPATEAAIASAQGLARATVGRDLPHELIGLWHVVAGLDFNGTLIFPPRERPEPEFMAGLVETNTDLPAPPPYIHIGSFGDEFLSWNAADDSYATIDAINQHPIPSYDSFDALVDEYVGRYLVTWARKRAPQLLEGL